MKQEKIINYLNKKYPISKAEKWDFVGFSIEIKNQEINKILISLDVNDFSISEAIKNKVDMIISFHPFCFAPSWKEIYKYDLTKKQLVNKLKKNKISVFSIHTNFDQDKKGTKYWFSKKLDNDENKFKYFKYAFIYSFNNSFSKFVNQIKNIFKINTVLSNVHNKNLKIKNIYICPGAGNIYDFMKINKKENIDLLVTSDLKWNEQQVLNSMGVKFVIIPHKTEDVFVDALGKIIKEQFVDVKVIKYIQDDFIKGY